MVGSTIRIYQILLLPRSEWRWPSADVLTDVLMYSSQEIFDYYNGNSTQLSWPTVSKSGPSSGPQSVQCSVQDTERTLRLQNVYQVWELHPTLDINDEVNHVFIIVFVVFSRIRRNDIYIYMYIYTKKSKSQSMKQFDTQWLQRHWVFLLIAIPQI